MNSIPGFHDIHELDPISYWPLPLSAWVTIVISLLVVALLLAWIWKRMHRPATWQRQLLDKLSEIDTKLRFENAHLVTLEISNMIRRLAIYKFGRDTCAGLQGKAWLDFLTEKDPKKFHWNETSQFLVSAPYAPVNQTLRSGGPNLCSESDLSLEFKREGRLPPELPPEQSLEQIHQTIQAMKGWVR
jgi:hypothetical protein